MASKVLKLTTFGGLNLLDDQLEIGAGGAVSCGDIALDTPGQIRTRDGYFKVATLATAASRVHAYINSGTVQYVTSSATKLEAFDASGTAIASVAASGPHSMVTYGASSPVVYTTSTNDSTIRKWNGAAWSTVATASVHRIVTQDTDSNRLVLMGGEGGSRVRFSDVAAPETFTTNSFEDVTPGDGEFITGGTCWQGLVFAFKQSRFFVFYGEGVDTGGNPIFNYRTVEGVGARQGQASVCSTPQGVYFIGQDGVYLTTGGAPVLVSRPLLPLFGGMPGSITPSTNVHLAWNKGRLFMTLGKSAGDPRVFVWFRNTDSWVEWPALMAGKAGGGFHGNQQLAIAPFVNGTDLALYAMTTSCATDGEASSGAGNGTPIAWSWKSGRYEPAGGNEAVVPEQSLIGSGTVTMAIDSDLYATQTGPATVLGTAPAIAEGWPNPLDQAGTWLQTTLSGTGPAVVTEVRHHVSFAREVSNARS